VTSGTVGSEQSLLNVKKWLISKVSKVQSFLLPTDAQENCFLGSVKIYIKIAIAATCFGVITIIRACTV